MSKQEAANGGILPALAAGKLPTAGVLPPLSY
jgi:hypothetical protein